MLSYSVYKNKSSSKWVTFIHGAGGSSSIWFRQIRAFNKEFNLLLIDLSGHGKSKSRFEKNSKNAYTFEVIVADILNVLNHLKIKSSNFIGVSLGTIIVREIAEKHPKFAESLVLVGAILKFNFRSNFLMRLGNSLRSLIPYLLLYKLFAFIIMPNKNHKESRLLLVRECKKLYQKEFIRWCKLTIGINQLLKIHRMNDLNIPSLYIMGEEDYLFLPSIKKAVSNFSNAQLHISKNAGHIANVDQPLEFNNVSINFLKSL